MKRSTMCFFFTLLVPVSFSLLLSAQAAELSAGKLEVKGRRVLQLYDKGTNQTISFHLRVDGCKSWIRTQAWDPGTEYIEWGTDGSQSYLLSKDSGKPRGVPTFQPGPNGNLVKANPTPSANLGFLQLRWDTTPQVMGHISALWLIFGSGCYFQSKQQGAELEGPLLFSNVLPKMRQRIRDRGYWNRSTINSNYFDTFACVRDDPMGHLGPYFGEQTNAFYRVLQWTNVAGHSFPSRTELQVFTPDPESKERYRSATAYTIDTFIDEIKPLGTNQVCFIGPKVPFFLFVTDHRIDPTATGKELVHYRSRDGTIKTIEEAERLALEAR